MCKEPFVEFIHRNLDCLVIDIGAQIGEYTLFAAQLVKVLTVEPFYDNILRLHKAARMENIQHRITLIQNAISDRRGEVKMLEPSSNNIGGQGLLNSKKKTYSKNVYNKYLVETIIFDDLVEYLPKTNENKMHKTAILKIDIEGFEPYAFQNAHKLFDAIDIKVIFMEWGTLAKERELNEYIVHMIDFLVRRNYSAYGNNELLNTDKWNMWPWDVIWKK